MTVEERLREARAPGEREAAARAWAVVQADALARKPPDGTGRAAKLRTSRRRVALASAGAAALALAATLTPAGASISRFVDRAMSAPARHHAAPPAALPARGRVLVATPTATWVLGAHRARRTFPGLHDPAWSPHGRFVAGVRGGTLTVLTPAGRTVWSLPASGARDPSWAPDGRYIAYSRSGSLRLVWGNGTHDTAVAEGSGAAAWAWRPGIADSPQTFAPELAYVTERGTLLLRHMFTGKVLWRRHVGPDTVSLAWSPGGGWLVAAGHSTRLLRADGWIIGSYGPAQAVAFAPRSSRFALAAGKQLLLSRATSPSGIRTVATSRQPFSGPSFSPDGRWLLAAAGQRWVLVRTGLAAPAVRTLKPPGGASAQPAGWCCVR